MVPHKSVISRLDGTACIELHKRNCPKAKDSFRTVVYFTSFVELIDFYFIQCHCTGHFALIMRTIAINTITYFASACKFYFHLYSFLCRELYFFIESFEGVFFDVIGKFLFGHRATFSNLLPEAETYTTALLTGNILPAAL